jgi:hypothetical protein
VYDEALVLGRLAMKMETRAESVEGLTFAIEGGGPSATLKLMWDTREFGARIAAKSFERRPFATDRFSDPAEPLDRR